MAVYQNTDRDIGADDDEAGQGSESGAAGTGNSSWPDNWRDMMAGGDEKFRKQLERYQSPADVGKKGRELEAKLSSGEYRRDLPRDATPEQLAEWKRERGLPEGVEGYLDNLMLPDGVVLGENDKPVASGFAEAAFRNNVTQDQFAGSIAVEPAGVVEALKAVMPDDDNGNSDNALFASAGPQVKAFIGMRQFLSLVLSPEDQA